MGPGARPGGRGAEANDRRARQRGDLRRLVRLVERRALPSCPEPDPPIPQLASAATSAMSTRTASAPAHVLMPHIVAPMGELMAQHTSWNVLARAHAAVRQLRRRAGEERPGEPGRRSAAPGPRRRCARMREAGVALRQHQPGRRRHRYRRPHRVDRDPAEHRHRVHAGRWRTRSIAKDRHDRDFPRRRTASASSALRRYLTGAVRRHREGRRLGGRDQRRCRPRRIVALARDMASTRTMVNGSWSLQRSHHGEQPFWMIVTLGRDAGPDRLARRRLRSRLRRGQHASAAATARVLRADAAARQQPGRGASSPSPASRDMLLSDRATTFDYDGTYAPLPRHRSRLLGGRQPVPSPPGPEPAAPRLAQARDVIVVHEQFWTPTAKHGRHRAAGHDHARARRHRQSPRERYLVAMKRAFAPVGEARDDYAIFAELAARLGASRTRSPRTATRCSGCATSTSRSRPRGQAARDRAAGVRRVLGAGPGRARCRARRRRAAAAVSRRSGGASAADAVGRIELFSERIAGFELRRLRAAMPSWYEPAEWLGSPKAATYPLHLISDQPSTKLHSQLDHGALSQANKVARPRADHAECRRCAAARGIADGDMVRVFNERGACLAGARLSRPDPHRRRAAVDRRLVRPGRPGPTPGRSTSTATPTC